MDEVIDHYDDTLDRIEHFVYDLAGNRRSLTLDQGRNGTIDESRIYEYNANDRLLIELLDTTGDGQPEQTTSYGYILGSKRGHSKYRQLSGTPTAAF